MPEPSHPPVPGHPVKAAFDAIAPTYDAMRFLRGSAERLVDLAAIPAGARVLDVATGTGALALAAARRAGPGGRVLGVDLSPGMLDRARRKAAEAGLAGVAFEEGDAGRLGLPDGSFDVVLCGASLPFLADMVGAAREWRRLLAPGGRAAFSSFGPAFLQPLRELWAARLRRHGLSAPFPPFHRLGTPAACEALLREAGFEQVEVREEQLGYHETPAERWAELAGGLEVKPLQGLPPEQRERIRAEHLAELAATATERGLWVEVPALLAVGR